MLELLDEEGKEALQYGATEGYETAPLCGRENDP